MPRPDKVAAVDEVKQHLTDSAATLLTDYRGLSVTELAELRTELRKNDATYKVVKNTLTRRAASEAGIDGLDEYLVGPTALVFCAQDPVGPAKVLKAFQKDHPALLFKAGYLDGEVLDTDAALKLAELESREELLAKVAGMMNNALAGFARLMQAAVVDMGRLMAALEDAGGPEAKGFTPVAPAATPEAEATEPEPEAEEAPAAEAADEAPAATDDEASEDASDDTSEDTSEDTSDDTSEDAAEDDDGAEDASVVDQATEVAEDAVEKVADVTEAVAEKVEEAATDVADAVAGSEASDEDAAGDDEDAQA